MRVQSDINAEQITQQLGEAAAGKAHQSRTHIGIMPVIKNQITALQRHNA